MRAEKQLLLDEIATQIKGSNSLIVASYDKLPPNSVWELRSKLSQAGSHLEVVRKRIFLKAALDAGIQIDESLLKGHVGVVFVQGSDAIPSAKIVLSFSEANSHSMKLLCGQMDGKIVLGNEVEELSRLPGLDEMRAILLGLLVSPMSQTLAVLEAAVEKSQNEGDTNK